MAPRGVAGLMMVVGSSLSVRSNVAMRPFSSCWMKPSLAVEVAAVALAGAAKAHALRQDALGAVKVCIGIEAAHKQHGGDGAAEH
jgi:hypothetical protein